MRRAARMVLSAAVLLWVVAIGVMASACGGGGGSPGAMPAPPVALAPPAASSAGPGAPVIVPPVTPPASAPLPDIVTPGGGQGWRQVWAEVWASSPILGGWVRPNGLSCDHTLADGDRPIEGSFAAGYAWAPFGSLGGTLEARDGQLHVDLHTAAGAIQSHHVLPHDKPLRLLATVDLKPDPGAWLGLPLFSDETDYRQIVLTPTGDRSALDVWLYAPCYAERIGIAALGPRRLGLEYTPPPAEICWRYLVDGQVWREERCDHRGAPLMSPPRAALYLINLELGDRTGSGMGVRAVVGPITVETR